MTYYKNATFIRKRIYLHVLEIVPVIKLYAYGF